MTSVFMSKVCTCLCGGYHDLMAGVRENMFNDCCNPKRALPLSSDDSAHRLRAASLNGDLMRPPAQTFEARYDMQRILCKQAGGLWLRDHFEQAKQSNLHGVLDRT